MVLKDKQYSNSSNSDFNPVQSRSMMDYDGYIKAYQSSRPREPVSLVIVSYCSVHHFWGDWSSLGPRS